MDEHVPKESCYFYHYCTSDSCIECQNSGRYYLANRAFIKKTLIPKVYTPADFDPSSLLLMSGWDLKNYSKHLVDKADKGHGLYLWSENTGTGKTASGCLLLLKYLANTMHRSIIDEIPTPVLYLNVVELMDKLRSNMSRPDDDFETMWREQFTDKAPQLLLLDDIGAERPTEWVKERLYSLINSRWANNRATIYTSNCSPGKLEEVVGNRIASRIFNNNTIVVKFGDRDRRREG